MIWAFVQIQLSHENTFDVIVQGKGTSQFIYLLWPSYQYRKRSRDHYAFERRAGSWKVTHCRVR